MTNLLLNDTVVGDEKLPFFFSTVRMRFFSIVDIPSPFHFDIPKCNSFLNGFGPDQYPVSMKFQYTNGMASFFM